MKSYAFSGLLVTVFVATGLFTVAANDLPQVQNFARYEPMMQRSPFAVATAVAAPAATPNFAKDLYIANAARTSDGDLITLASTTDKNFKEYLSTKEPVEGYSVTNIEWSDRVGETKVTITKDGQTATLSFNQALISQGVPNPVPPPQAQPQPPGVGVPPVPQYNNNVNVIKPAPIPTLPTPPPRVRGLIQRNPAGVPPQAQPQQPQAEEIETKDDL